MHQWASRYVEGSQHQDALWPHAEWARPPGKNSKWLAVARMYRGNPGREVMKDNRLLIAAPEESSVPMPMAGFIHDRFLAALARGLGEADWVAMPAVL